MRRHTRSIINAMLEYYFISLAINSKEYKNAFKLVDMKNFFRFIFSKLFFRQFLIAIILFAVLFIGTVVGLHLFTRHGETQQVPDIKGYNEAQVQRITQENDFRYVIIDSVYSQDVDPGTVFDQIPPAGAFVKEDRKLFIILNAKNRELVQVPSMKNVSLRQAKVMITKSGLKLKEIIYVPSEYRDLVINQLMGDTLISAGTSVPKWSEIVLHVGRGLGNSKTSVPYLRGMYWKDAKELIPNMHLNEGVIIDDENLSSRQKDSAIVWKQYPQPGTNVQYGKSVDVWLSTDTAVVFEADSTLRHIYSY